MPKVDRKDISCGSKCVSGGDGSDGAGSPVVRSPTRWPNKSDKSIRNKHYNSIGVTWLGWLAMRVGSFVVLAITLASKVTVVCVCVFGSQCRSLLISIANHSFINCVIGNVTFMGDETMVGLTTPTRWHNKTQNTIWLTKQETTTDWWFPPTLTDQVHFGLLQSPKTKQNKKKLHESSKLSIFPNLLRHWTDFNYVQRVISWTTISITSFQKWAELFLFHLLWQFHSCQSEDKKV